MLEANVSFHFFLLLMNQIEVIFTDVLFLKYGDHYMKYLHAYKHVIDRATVNDDELAFRSNRKTVITF